MKILLGTNPLTRMVEPGHAHHHPALDSMMVHSVTHLLTFNEHDFRRYPGITVITPSSVLQPPFPP